MSGEGGRERERGKEGRELGGEWGGKDMQVSGEEGGGGREDWR